MKVRKEERFACYSLPGVNIINSFILAAEIVGDKIKQNKKYLEKEFGMKSLMLYAKNTFWANSDVDLFYEMQEGCHMTLRRVQRLENLSTDCYKIIKQKKYGQLFG